jgi:HNH endonuclease
VFALMGLTEEPAMLDGYGPIPPSMARALVADGADSFHRVLVDPRDGAPLEIGRKNYRIPKALKQWLRLRDGKCSFPGCRNQSLDNEADHLTAWEHGGTTGISNLAQTCPKHHRLKHTTPWQPTPASPTEPPGWISPTGRHYKSEHPDWEPPTWPAAVERLISDLPLADPPGTAAYGPGVPGTAQP